MGQRIERLKESASQTAGPYVHIGLTPNFCDIGGVYPEDLGIAMVNEATRGERITIKYIRHDERQQVTVTLEERPSTM